MMEKTGFVCERCHSGNLHSEKGSIYTCKDCGFTNRGDKGDTFDKAASMLDEDKE